MEVKVKTTYKINNTETHTEMLVLELDNKKKINNEK